MLKSKLQGTNTQTKLADKFSIILSVSANPHHISNDKVITFFPDKQWHHIEML